MVQQSHETSLRETVGTYLQPYGTQSSLVGSIAYATHQGAAAPMPCVDHQ